MNLIVIVGELRLLLQLVFTRNTPNPALVRLHEGVAAPVPVETVEMTASVEIWFPTLFPATKLTS